MTTFDELFAEHNLTPNERKALVMHLATLRAQKTVEALQDCPLAAAPSTPPPAVVDERETFEAFIAKDGGDLHTFGTGADMHYRNSGVNHTWIGWKARARLAAHAVVEAVPLEWPIERAADMLTAYAELVKATGRYAEEHYIPEIENVAAELRGIAPKAAQPVEGER